jgi:hypothetical protein
LILDGLEICRPERGEIVSDRRLGFSLLHILAD